MKELKFTNAYYIKLGAKGTWADNSIKEGIVRFEWKQVPLQDIIEENWEIIKKTIKQDYDGRGKQSGSSQDYEALKRICEASNEVVFITFHKGRMWWCSLDNSPVQKDDISKFRKTVNGWTCNPNVSYAKPLLSNEISGKISKTQAFQGTLCKFRDNELEIINRIINGIHHPNVDKIRSKKHEICKLTTVLVKDLHWKDCEILTDLIFQQSGWHRVSMQGGSMEFMDMEYLDPINKETYAVQVKSGANKSDFINYAEKFNERVNRKFFFIAFNPDSSLEQYKNENVNIELLFGDKLSELIFDLGLLNWVLNKSF